MPGRKLTREAGKRLDAYGEDGIFELYMEHWSVRKLLANLPPEVGTMSTAPFYSWLKADEGRWAAWQDVREAIANDLVEESLAIADEAEEGSVPSARLRVERRRWMAERYDRTQFGRPDTQVNVAVGIGDEFLAALKKVEEWAKAKKEAEAKAEPEQIPEADYEVVETVAGIVEEDEEPPAPSSNPPVPNPYKTTRKRLSRGVNG